MKSANVRRLIPGQQVSVGRTVMGWISSWIPGCDILVDYKGNTIGPIPAKSIVPMTPDELTSAVATKHEILISFVSGDTEVPVIVGLVQAVPQFADMLFKRTGRQADESPSDIAVDGKRIVLQGEDEVVIRCGPARIVLDRYGHLSIKGTKIHSQSKGANRITGGSVRIN